MKRRIAGHRITRVQPVCVECGGMGRMISGDVLLPSRPTAKGRMYYRCDCGAWTSCHQGTAIAAGRPGSPRTRYLRGKAHEAFDAIWGREADRSAKGYGYARTRAYKWLARELGLSADDCHIGQMTAELCEQVIALCNAKQGRAA
jgi:hypothetical protein